MVRVVARSCGFPDVVADFAALGNTATVLNLRMRDEDDEVGDEHDEEDDHLRLACAQTAHEAISSGVGLVPGGIRAGLQFEISRPQDAQMNRRQ